MLNFDEFTALNQREISVKKSRDVFKLDNEISKDATNDLKRKQNYFGSSEDLGDFLEIYQVQSFLIFLIVLDTFASFSVLSLRNIAEKNNQDVLFENFLVKFLNSFTSFTFLFFCLELILLLVVFKTSIFGHFGYIIDSIVLSFQLYHELKGYGVETRIMNILRFWRLIRLYNSMINIEKESHETTKLIVVEKIEKIEKLENNINQLENELFQEKTARESSESVLVGYKDEVETLNEALRIAAMDIAEIGENEDDDSLSDDDGDDTNYFVDANSIDQRSGRSQSSSSRTSAFGSMKSKNKINKPSSVTFLIREDGTFEKR